MDRSPVFSLDREIASAPFAAAPEKAQKLQTISKSITLVFDDQRADFSIAAVTRGDHQFVKASAGALNLLWCASYAYWLLYQGYIESQRAGGTQYRASEHPEGAEAVHLYRWALDSVLKPILGPWPVAAPAPAKSPEPNSSIHVANEIFLVAVGWILLHEIGHHHLRHANDPIGPTAKQEEFDADRFATDWILDDVSDPAVLLKRSLGIAVANVLLITLDLSRASFESVSHPPSYERFQRNLRERQLREEHPVHAFGAAMLQTTLTTFGVDIHLDLDATFDGFVDDLCFQLHQFAQAKKNG